MNEINHRIARNFSRAAVQYDAHAKLQKRIMQQAYAMIAPQLHEEAIVLDIGCGTGNFAKHAYEHAPRWILDGLDVAAGMCAVAKPYYRHMFCANMDQLPLKNHRYDAVFSNLALQWAEDAPKVFSEIYRVLKPAGYACISMFSEGTLAELADASARAGMDSVMPMRLPSHDEQAAKSQGFSIIEIANFSEVHYHTSAQDVLIGLRAIGAKKVRAAPSGFTGKMRFAEMLAYYEQKYRSARGVPASWHAAIFLLQKSL